jgi:hypothetical protein
MNHRRRSAVVGAVVKGLQAPPRKSLGFVGLMMKHGIGRERQRSCVES